MKKRKLTHAALALCLMMMFVLGGCSEPDNVNMDELLNTKATTGTTATESLSEDDLAKIESNKEAVDIDIIEYQGIRDFVNEYIDDPSWNFMNYEHFDLDLEDRDWIVEGVHIMNSGDGEALKSRWALLFDSLEHANEFVSDTNMQIVFDEKDDGSVDFDNSDDDEMEKNYYGTIYPDGFVIMYLDFDQ